MTNVKYSNRIMMSLHSLHKAIAAKKMKNKHQSVLTSTKMSDALFQKSDKVVEI